jgi:CheY-like chemotaxis protein
LILILSDINMPGMSGLELLPKAKAARPDVPVIMLTAYGDPDTRRKAMEGGADALLTKPIDFVTLRSEIDSRVGGAGAEVASAGIVLAEGSKPSNYGVLGCSPNSNTDRDGA